MVGWGSPDRRASSLPDSPRRSHLCLTMARMSMWDIIPIGLSAAIAAGSMYLAKGGYGTGEDS